MIVIGEKINGTRKSVAKAIEEKNREFIKNLAIRQVEAGADYLDINAGTHPDKETTDMEWLVQTVQEVTDVTLCLDSANPKALATGLEVANKTPMLNSLSGEKDRLEGVLPLACEYKTGLIVLAMDDNGIPATVEERLEIVKTLVGMTREGGLPDENLYIDPLITTLATDTESGNRAFEAMRLIKEQFPAVHLTAGLSNISFGLPSRSIINQVFAALAIAAGMDSAIFNPEDAELRAIIYAAEAVLGKDDYCMNYLRAYRAGL
ncbi:MAG: methyltetrahydrofolate cobalamin methyltransferase, partial [Deltaproteobacteria bacterium]|nr:methyltetrahydrofolate cobalamin methyltransferase [Deltaproteobacteria bacterium]